MFMFHTQNNPTSIEKIKSTSDALTGHEIYFKAILVRFLTAVQIYPLFIFYIKFKMIFHLWAYESTI